MIRSREDCIRFCLGVMRAIGRFVGQDDGVENFCVTGRR